MKGKFRKLEARLDRLSERFLSRHPIWGIFILLLGAPVAVLGCVCLGTIAIVFPLAGLLGWL